MFTPSVLLRWGHDYIWSVLPQNHELSQEYTLQLGYRQRLTASLIIDRDVNQDETYIVK